MPPELDSRFLPVAAVHVQAVAAARCGSGYGGHGLCGGERGRGPGQVLSRPLGASDYREPADKISRRARRLFLSGGRLYSLVEKVWVLR
jgi:hypothetical protein